MHKVISFSHVTVCVFGKKYSWESLPFPSSTLLYSSTLFFFFFKSFLLLELEGRLFLLVAPDLVLGDGFFPGSRPVLERFGVLVPDRMTQKCPLGRRCCPCGSQYCPWFGRKGVNIAVLDAARKFFSLKRNGSGEKRKNRVMRLKFNDKAIVKYCLLKMFYG